MSARRKPRPLTMMERRAIEAAQEIAPADLLTATATLVDFVHRNVNEPKRRERCSAALVGVRFMVDRMLTAYGH